uniref:Uncharacterized protein n=1 Tax=Candidatus Kentrum sp. FM TaxID=2126340 RepID=A0A450RZF8_9GAMM|nr:MAG: hypothetical protein BECKFM1743C_GA0114222_100145 [Candidatus Kentron sp. FM]VFJ53491.1 MAG: hypothetical protein BECKFM1743A_GA0114220_101155 [Candidatus Kentron sp. FM]VFK06338.1 MAG: hypothetical protein BECKFM1743B_GA0114221_1001413 [Candidatus Kentron sp. FM]
MTRQPGGSCPSTPVPGQKAAGETAQLDVVLTFFGIILVFLSLLTFAVKTEQEDPVPTDYRAIEAPTHPVHTPSLAYVVPFYRFLLLDEQGLFTLDLTPIAHEVRASELDVDSFGRTLYTSSGAAYGMVSLQSLDISGFWMQLDAEKLHGTDLLQPLMTARTRPDQEMDYRALLDAVAQREEQGSAGFAMLHYAEGQGALADTIVGLLLEQGWRIKAQPLRDGKILLQRHPDYFVLTDYFR